MTFEFKKAQRKGIWARFAIDGPTGSGKTYSALAIANGLLYGTEKRCALIDTERRSSERYADVFDFDVIQLDTFEPSTYCDAIKSFDPETHGVLIVDSISHAWMGKGGALEQVDRIAARSQSSNTFAAWRDVTPMHNELVDTMLSVPGHLIVTMRSKMDYVLEPNERGKLVPKKVGMAPIQREGIQYEFDIVGDMDLDNGMAISKTRASFLNGDYIKRPDSDLGRKILEWCGHIDPSVTDFDLRALARHGNPENIKTYCATRFSGRGPRDLTPDEFHLLRQGVEKGEHLN